jgi:Putative bacterial sensory transduction regulator
MPDQVLHPDDITLESISQLLDDALFEVELDEENQSILLREDILARIRLSESNDRMLCICYYRIKEDAQRIERLELVNRINDQYVLVRAAVGDEDELWIDYSIVLKGGVTRKQVAQAVRMFLKVAELAVKDSDEDNIVV